MYFYKVKLKYALDSRCESISEKTVKGKRKGKSLSLDTLSLEQKKPTIVVAIVGFRMIKCYILHKSYDCKTCATSFILQVSSPLLRGCQ